MSEANCVSFQVQYIVCYMKTLPISATTGAQQCYFCDSEIAGGQGDVDEPTKCGSLTNCQTDEVRLCSLLVSFPLL